MRSASGSIMELERGKLYRVRVEGPRDPMTGKRRRLSRNIRGSRKDAEAAKAQLLLEVLNPQVVASPMTLDMFAESVYLPWARANLRERTVMGYEGNYRCLLADDFGRLLLTDISPLLIQQHLNTMPQRRAFEAWKLLRQILNRAVKMQMLDRNPVLLVDAPKYEAYRPEVLTREEWAAYVKNARGADIEAALLVILGCGTTRSETVGLNWLDIGADGSVVIDNAVVDLGGRPHDDKPKNAFRVRTVHLPASLTARVNEIRPACEFVRIGSTIEPRPLVCGNGLARIRPDALSTHYEKWRDTLPEGVKRIALKNLRHTSLTLAVEAGVDLLAVSRRAGHAGTAITAKYYLRPSEAVDIDAAAKLDAMLGSTQADTSTATGL